MSKNKKKTASSETEFAPCEPVLLRGIKSPADLKALPEEQLPALCREIRSELVRVVTKNGGHLASNLGAVELSVALHRVFDCPKDHFIFDVGHQSYVHKMLTGRYDRFDTLRTGGGLSGFTKRSESAYDCFGTGHSSTSLSAALGFAQADRLAGSDAWTIAVVGDGAFTGGMIHEALNNIASGLRLIIILNENEMSISKNIGRFATHLSKVRRTEGYFETKRRTRVFIQQIPLIGGWLFRRVRNTKKAVKNALYGSNYFEDMGLYYLGPADGNDLDAVTDLLTVAKQSTDSVVIHLKTRKGKGYPPAEADPGRYHGMSPAPQGGQVKPAGENFSRHLGQTLIGLAEADPHICAITAAMSDGTGLESFRKAFPDRFFDVGIAEEHALTFAAGLAADGYRPVTAIYSSFMQRAYDQIIHDIALQHLPVVMCIDRAGLSQQDGATHHGIFDVSFLSGVPGMTIYTPASLDVLDVCVRAALRGDGPAAIRYPNAGDNDRVVSTFYPHGADGTPGIRTDFDGKNVDAVAVCHGAMASELLDASDLLAARGIRLGIILCEFIKPYDKLTALIAPRLPDSLPVVFCEEEIKAGGFGMMLSEAMRKTGCLEGRRWDIIALEESFAIQCRPEPVRRTAGVDAASIAERVASLL